MPRGKFDSTNQGHYPDLGSDTSSAVPDPDLEIRRGRRSSRPLDKGGSGLPKKFFGPFGPQFGLKIRGGGGRSPWAPLLDPLLISIEFLRSFLRCHLAGKPVVASPNVGCFLRLNLTLVNNFSNLILIGATNRSPFCRFILKKCPIMLPFPVRS